MFRLKFFYSIVFTLSTIVLLIACNNSSDNKKEMSQAEMIERGKYLVTSGSCHDCHSPKIMTPQGPVVDTTRALSGSPSTTVIADVDPQLVQPGKWYLFVQDLTAAVGPWGASFSANLTPDIETGIGSWQEEMFINALRTGKHLGVGRPIMPPMPWEFIGKFSDEDLKSIFAYLKSLKPVKNKVPDNIPPDKLFAKK
ncbi:MAG: diheme cytochrome c-553 [Ignavibacterium album]|uniref:c-type cytochrome n=1 Tax=Ignavibacterium album TaxID=591197 RepID=UPI0026EDF156|nr:c-type cytochrome [Ignavibacterium album]MCX8105629.1 diheme cytochrome c-553 [Ignavibacterium album]